MRIDFNRAVETERTVQHIRNSILHNDVPFKSHFGKRLYADLRIRARQASAVLTPISSGLSEPLNTTPKAVPTILLYRNMRTRPAPEPGRGPSAVETVGGMIAAAIESAAPWPICTSWRRRQCLPSLRKTQFRAGLQIRPVLAGYGQIFANPLDRGDGKHFGVRIPVDRRNASDACARASRPEFAVTWGGAVIQEMDPPRLMCCQ